MEYPLITFDYFIIKKTYSMKENLLIVTILLLLGSCEKINLPPITNLTVNIEADSISFAIIGDFGEAGDPAFKVSELVKSWSPDFVVTLGDNNYDRGELSTFQENIGQYYCDFIYNPDAPADCQCNGMATLEAQNKFFPTLGNHDQQNANYSQPYLAAFTLPGKETYYSFRWGPAEFFTVNSGKNGEADCCGSEQASWLKTALLQSKAKFKVVYFHHPPYSSSNHGNFTNMQWPFEEWGASIVLSGHSHLYERVNKIDTDFYYVVNGLGGRKKIYGCNVNPVDEIDLEHFCYNETHGAIKVEANNDFMKLSFIAIDDPDAKIDEIILFD